MWLQAKVGHYGSGAEDHLANLTSRCRRRIANTLADWGQPTVEDKRCGLPGLRPFSWTVQRTRGFHHTYCIFSTLLNGGAHLCTRRAYSLPDGKILAAS